VALLDASSDVNDVSAGGGDAALAPLPLNDDIENWPCAASIACMAAGDSLPEPGLLDFFEPGSAESEPDIVNGSEPLPKNPADCVEDDETCEPIDLTTSHAADAAPKAISMIKTSQCRSGRPLPSLPMVSKCRARQKAQQIQAVRARNSCNGGRKLLPWRQDLPIPVLTPFVDANRPPLRSKRLQSYRIAAGLCPC
jgi:hypothetical protein